MATRKSEPKSALLKKPLAEQPEANIDDLDGPAQFSQELAVTLHEQINAVIADAIHPHGLELVPDPGTFTNDRLTFRVEIRSAAKTTQEWSIACAIYGFTPEHLGATFTRHNKLLRIMGYSILKPGKPIRCTHMGTGVTWYYPADTVKRLIGAKAAMTSDTQMSSR
jgi:hypothetical protein